MKENIYFVTCDVHGLEAHESASQMFLLFLYHNCMYKCNFIISDLWRTWV